MFKLGSRHIFIVLKNVFPFLLFICFYGRRIFCFRSSLQPIRTMTCDYALCCIFAPGDRHAIVGTKVSLVAVELDHAYPLF